MPTTTDILLHHKAENEFARQQGAYSYALGSDFFDLVLGLYRRDAEGPVSPTAVEQAGITRHTPGPWEREGTTVYALMHAGWHGGQENKKNRFTASVYGDLETPRAEVEANACLIQASPELADALEALVRLYGDYAPGLPFFHPEKHPLNVARAALRKAGLS
jgi:hypothetical protein